MQVLLVQRGQPPFAGSWALPGGFVHVDEPADYAAARQLVQETGVPGVPLHLLGVYSAAGRDPRGLVVSATYCALLPPTARREPEGASDAAPRRWWNVGEAESLLPFAFDHGAIVADARRWVRRQVLGSLAIRAFMPPTFPLAELHAVLRAIVPDANDHPFRFRRKVIARRIVEPTGERVTPNSRWAAKLFRFTGEAPELSLF